MLPSNNEKESGNFEKKTNSSFMNKMREKFKDDFSETSSTL